MSSSTPMALVSDASTAARKGHVEYFACGNGGLVMSATDTSQSTGDYKVLPKATWRLIQAEQARLKAERDRLADELVLANTELDIARATLEEFHERAKAAVRLWEPMSTSESPLTAGDRNPRTSR